MENEPYGAYVKPREGGKPYTDLTDSLLIKIRWCLALIRTPRQSIYIYLDLGCEDTV